MLDFICPSCGQFAFDDPTCVSCDGAKSDDLTAD